MTPALITTIATAWIICGILNYGATLAWFQREYPLISHKKPSSDILFAAITSIAGPIALIVVTFMSKFFKYGFVFAPITPEERAHLCRKKYPELYTLGQPQTPAH